MILREVKETLSKKGQSTASEIASELNCDKKFVEHALEFWIKKNQAEAIFPQGHCTLCPGKTCTACPTNLVPVIYKWLDN